MCFDPDRLDLVLWFWREGGERGEVLTRGGEGRGGEEGREEKEGERRLEVEVRGGERGGERGGGGQVGKQQGRQERKSEQWEAGVKLAPPTILKVTVAICVSSLAGVIGEAVNGSCIFWPNAVALLIHLPLGNGLGGGRERGRRVTGSHEQVGRQRETGRQTGRQTDRQTDRQAGRQTGRQAGRQTDRPTSCCCPGTGPFPDPVSADAALDNFNFFLKRCRRLFSGLTANERGR